MFTTFLFLHRPNPTGVNMLLARVSRVSRGLALMIRIQPEMAPWAAETLNLTLILILRVNPHRALETIDNNILAIWYQNVPR